MGIINKIFLEKQRPVDKAFAGILFLIIIFGFFAFLSAAFGLLSRSGGPDFSSVITSQFILGLLPGLFLLFIVSRLPFVIWRRMSFVIFLFAIGLNLLLLLPLISLEHGGATRWLILGGLTFQPSELLKLAFLIYLSSWLSGIRDRLADSRFGIIPFLLILGTTVGILISQRDTDTTIIVSITAMIMYLSAGAKFKDAIITSILVISGFLVLVFARPYLKDRILAFVDPARDPKKTSYQVNQSLIAIGSGEMFGKGFGRSVQKFSRLPEPIGDSIYAVIGEEFGFMGSSFLVLLFATFLLIGLRISIRAPDIFSRLLSMGIVIMITTQSYVNIASMLGLIPISGLPLVFVSHGGSSLLVSLLSVGIVLNISRTAK